MNLTENKDCYLSNNQRELIKEIFRTNIGLNAYLTGGTCLAVFYLNHRKSEDIDIFFTKDVNLLYYTHIFRKLSSYAMVEASGFCSYMSKDIKLDFVCELSNIPKYMQVVKLDDVEIKIDTPENIAINKLRTISTRDAVRDLYDIGMLFTDYFKIKDLNKIYKKAVLIEDNLKDILYIQGIFKLATDIINKRKNNLLLKENVNFNKTLEKLNNTFEGLSNQLIKINNDIKIKKSHKINQINLDQS